MSQMASNTFWYTAISLQGKKSFGLLSAADRAHLADALRKRDLVLVRAWKLPVSLGEVGPGDATGRLPLKDDVALNEQLEILLERGVTLVEALDVVEGVVSKRSAPKIARLREMVSGGSSFAQACQRAGGFEDVSIGVYQAAERTGDLGPAAGRLAAAVRRRMAVRAKAVTVSIYPVIVAVVSFSILFGVLVFLVPTLGESVREASDEGLPWFSSLVFATGETLRANLPAVGVFILALLVGVVAFRSLLTRGLGAVARKIKPINDLLRSIELARFFGVLGAMTRSGVPLAEALSSATSTIGQPGLRTQLARLQRELIEGGLFRTLIERVDELPQSTRRLLVAAERSGDLDQAFDSLASRAAEEVERRSERLTAFMEPAVLLLIFSVIAPLIVAIALPMMNLRTG
jgi:type II secretory pathway component PulF